VGGLRASFLLVLKLAIFNSDKNCSVEVPETLIQGQFWVRFLEAQFVYAHSSISPYVP
jgi:hypothetical protein